MNSGLPADRRLILASSSPYRKQLLARLGLPFTSIVPQVDETALVGEAPAALAVRLAVAKARAVAQRFPDALIIGCDQVAVLDGKLIGKPGGHVQAIAQLERAAGKPMDFHTGLCLLDGAHGCCQQVVEPFRVYFRALRAQQVAAYVEREQAYACAGSFKAEGLGIALFERMAGDDPNSLIGLPLIRLVTMLENVGVAVL